MKHLKRKWLSTTVAQLALGAGIAAGGAITMANVSYAVTPVQKANPTAVSRTDEARVQLTGAHKKSENPCATKCNPCAAKCNPCAAKCNPCAAKGACGASNPCGACNPCGAGGALSSKCVVPRLAAANACNPCAAKKACGACNPCAAKCNPCAAKACNPCAAKCNPCAAKACNPCAAKNACGACNPCGACSPCGAGEAPELTAAESRAAYDCLKAEMWAGYAKSGLGAAQNYHGWDNVASSPYPSATHGGRLVNNYVNAVGAANYKRYEDAGPAKVGTVLAKDSFLVNGAGKTGPGPLFLMEKMHSGFNAKTGNWKYSIVMPNGAVGGETGGRNAANVAFCHDCHVAVGEDQDYMFFLPQAFRAK